MQHHLRKKNLIIFDMDGVIIDVSKSYRDTVRQSATLFFNPARASEKLPNPLFSLSDLANLKQSGGLNNDWDLTCLVISLLFSILPSGSIRSSLACTDTDLWQIYMQTIQKIDITAIAQYLSSRSYPLTALLADKGKQINAFIRRLYQGEVGQGNVIKQIFQEIYLGPDLFKSTYGFDSRVWHDNGLIHRETPLIGREILEQLHQNNILAIATGRPADEAAYPLDHFNLAKYFDMVYTLDDCLRAERAILKHEGRKVSLSKPSPFMLDAIAALKQNQVNRFFYIGDMPDDMIAAARAEADFIGVGVLFTSADKHRLKDELERCGADRIVAKTSDLLEVLV